MSEAVEHECDTCKYEDLSGAEEPCCDCCDKDDDIYEDGDDKWEPKDPEPEPEPERTCSTCKYEFYKVNGSPCADCVDTAKSPFGRNYWASKVDRGCQTCKHAQVSRNDEPCATCILSTSAIFSLWEPDKCLTAPHLRDCRACAYADLADNQFPCDCCEDLSHWHAPDTEPDPPDPRAPKHTCDTCRWGYAGHEQGHSASCNYCTTGPYLTDSVMDYWQAKAEKAEPAMRAQPFVADVPASFWATHSALTRITAARFWAWISPGSWLSPCVVVARGRTCDTFSDWELAAHWCEQQAEQMDAEDEAKRKLLAMGCEVYHNSIAGWWYITHTRFARIINESVFHALLLATERLRTQYLYGKLAEADLRAAGISPESEDA
jgi:hypothetical protein